MLPDLSCDTTEEIGRARLKLSRRALPALSRLTPEAKHARAKQRYSDDVPELITVFVPADRRAGRVLCYECVLELAFRQAGKLCRPLTQVQQKRWDFLGFSELSNIEVVAPTEGNSTPLAEEAPKFELFEWKGRNFSTRVRS